MTLAWDLDTWDHHTFCWNTSFGNVRSTLGRQNRKTQRKSIIGLAQKHEGCGMAIAPFPWSNESFLTSVWLVLMLVDEAAIRL